MTNDVCDRGEFIVYLCPLGELNSQIEFYFQQSLKLCGRNKAHQYMPHCTLTGFFTDQINALDYYLNALEQVAINQYNLQVQIKQLRFSEKWHGLELEAAGIKQLIQDFSQIETSPTRQEDLRLKDWLHLSLAYGYDPKVQDKLKNLAQQIIELSSPVDWELRFYQKYPDWSWRCHRSWPL